MRSPYRYALLVLLVFPVLYVGFTRLYAAAIPAGAAIVSSLTPEATIAASPGRADAENTFTIGHLRAHAVRILSRSLDMDMGVVTYNAGAQAAATWRVQHVEVPMVGRWGIEVQARRSGTWVTVGTVAYYVPFSGTMHAIAPSAPVAR